MLTISNDTLPNNALSYLAFRVACLDTLERLTLAQQFPDDDAETFGFLTEVPFLRAVPPQVQLDLLATTWQKHLDDDRVESDLVDESVIFAACETTARITEHSPELIHIWQQTGPQWLSLPINADFAKELRHLHLSLANEGDFLVISQFEDLPPFEALRLKAQFGIQPGKCQAMLEVLERWHAAPGMAGRLTGLLTDREVAQVMSAVVRTCRRDVLPW